MIPCTRILYRRFRTEHAKSWGVSPSTYYRAVGFSYLGRSVYIEMNGRVQVVPRDVLTFSDM